MTPELHRRWRELGYWRDLTLDQAFGAAAARCPDALLTIHSAERPATLRLQELREQGQRLAGALAALGVRAGDVVAAQLPNWAETALVYQAAAALGCVILPIVTIYGEHELGFVLRHSGARVLFVPGVWRRQDHPERVRRVGAIPGLLAVVVVGGEAPDGFLSWERFAAMGGPVPAPVVSPDATALLVYTSGTTAQPKGVLHSANSWLAEIAQANPEHDPDSRVLSPYPAGHVAGAIGVMSHAAAGRRTVLFDVWDPVAAARSIESDRISHTSGTPFHYLGLLDAVEATGADVSSLRACGTGGATVPEAMIERAERLGIRLFRRYGMSEHPTVSQSADGDTLGRRGGTDGRARDGVEIRIVDDDGRDVAEGAEGEVATRGPDMYVGYSDPALTAAATLPGGWYLSGDIGRLDADGYLAITDRKKDIIIRGGENISSREVEDLLLLLPGVREAAAVAYPDPRLGERICAYLITEPGVEIDVAAVDAAFAAMGVARQKTPERVVLAQDLPRTPAGKIRKAQLRQELRSAAERS